MFLSVWSVATLVGQTIEDGKVVAESVLAKYPKLKVSVLSGDRFLKPEGIEILGSGTTYPTAGFILPLKDWNALTKTQQVSLVMFVESRIPIIREHPQSYALNSPFAAIYERELTRIRQIAYDAWFIGTAEKTNGNFYLGNKLVVGDGAWANDEAPRKAIKASDFRSSSRPPTPAQVSSEPESLEHAFRRDPRIEQGFKVSLAFVFMHPDPAADGTSFFSTPKVLEDSSSKRCVLRARVPDDAWSEMSDSDQKAFATYIKWLAQDASLRPEQHQPDSIRPNTPEWKRAVELARKMSPDSWEIIVCTKNSLGKWVSERAILKGK